MTRRNYFIKSSSLLGLVLFLLIAQGCKPRVIPSTNVSPSRINKKVVAFLEKYKLAYEKRSVSDVMELVSLDFSDPRGSEDPADEMNYPKLQEFLDGYFPRIQDTRLRFFVQRIAKIEKDKYEVVFYFDQQILHDTPSGEKWISVKDVNRMILKRRSDSNRLHEFEILQGI